jgi:hypothetical protein
LTLQTSPNILAEFITNNLKDLVGFLIVVAGGAFALWRWSVDQKWRRVQYAYGLIKEFLNKPTTVKAMEMLDGTRRIELFPDEPDHSKRKVRIDEVVMIEALATFEQQDTFDKIPFAVRVIFDQFFSDLSLFQHHIDAGLIRFADVRPYLDYWFQALAGKGKVRSGEFGAQVGKFLVYFGYRAVIDLIESAGYRFSDPTEISVAPQAGQRRL